MELSLKKIDRVKDEGKYLYSFQDEVMGTVIGMMDVYPSSLYKGKLACSGGGDNFPLSVWLEMRREDGIELTFYEIVETV